MRLAEVPDDAVVVLAVDSRNDYAAGVKLLDDPPDRGGPEVIIGNV